MSKATGRFTLTDKGVLELYEGIDDGSRTCAKCTMHATCWTGTDRGYGLNAANTEWDCQPSDLDDYDLGLLYWRKVDHE